MKRNPAVMIAMSAVAFMTLLRAPGWTAEPAAGNLQPQEQALAQQLAADIAANMQPGRTCDSLHAEPVAFGNRDIIVCTLHNPSGFLQSILGPNVVVAEAPHDAEIPIAAEILEQARRLANQLLENRQLKAAERLKLNGLEKSLKIEPLKVAFD